MKTLPLFVNSTAPPRSAVNVVPMNLVSLAVFDNQAASVFVACLLMLPYSDCFLCDNTAHPRVGSEDVAFSKVHA
jgi:hypothetical protein